MRNYLLLLLMLPSCINTLPLASPIVQEKVLSPFPPKPSLVEYSKKPIISSINENYEVSGEFVGNGIKLKKYADNVDSWKTLNNIK
jgi:hypothetical protein